MAGHIIPTSSKPLNMRGAKMMAALTWMTYPAKFWLELGGGRPTMKLLSVAVVLSRALRGRRKSEVQ